jgi:hypothetical protein
MMSADEAGWETVGTVHDEGLWEVDEAIADEVLHIIEADIEELPRKLSWAAGLPMKGEGFVAARYGK